MTLALVLVFVFPVAVRAADINVEWKQSAGATGYKIETSEDLGATWTKVPTLVFTLHTEGTLELARATIPVADNVLVLGRCGAYNDAGISWRLESGFFYNSAWMPLPAPTGGGVN